MALTSCPECGHAISEQAATCPSCGAPQLPPSRRRAGRVLKLAIIVVGVAVIGTVVQQRLAPQRSADQIARDQAAADAADKRAKVALESARGLRDLMRDPDSFVIESMTLSQDSSIVCAEYRSRNVFGGMAREFVVVRNGKPVFKNTALWNKFCTQDLFDLTAQVKRAG